MWRPIDDAGESIRPVSNHVGGLDSRATSESAAGTGSRVVCTPDKGIVLGHQYGAGERAVILVAHGGYSNKERWEKQARLLADAGFRVLAFDTRAGVELKRSGKETDCLYDPACMAVDVLSAVRYLRGSGAKTVSVIGGSAGGAWSEGLDRSRWLRPRSADV